MKTAVMDAEMREKLHGGTAKVVLTDEEGEPVGHYVPDDLYRSILNLVFPEPFSREEALEEYRRGEFLTTDELRKSLRESMRRWTGDPNFEC